MKLPGADGSVERVRKTSGIASDAGLFEDILEESTDAVRNLESDWLYQIDGQVFGPVKPRELLEMLYHAEISPDTLISCEEDEFQPLRRYGVFRAHLPKVEKHQQEIAAAKEKDRLDLRRRFRRRLVFAILAGLILIGSSASLAWWLRQRAQENADREKEAKLKAEVENLLASVTIEPPLLPLVEEEPEEPPPPAGSKVKRKPRKKRMKVTGGGGVSGDGTGDLQTDEIMAGVGKAFGGFKRCIVEQIQRDSESIPEQLVLTFQIDNEGTPKSIDLGDRHLRRTPLKPCMAGHLAKVRWRKFKGEVKNVEYPISIGR